MGADMIAAYLTHPTGADLDWDAAAAAVAALDPDSDDYAYQFLDEDINSAEFAEHVTGLFADLRGIIDDGARDTTLIVVGGYDIHLTGGLSWGDGPTDSFDTFDRASWFPTVLAAIGFTTDTDGDASDA